MNSSLVVLFILGVIIFVMICSYSQKSGFTFNNSDYQYSNADISKEYDYYGCIANECGGNTQDYLCLQRCHLKSYRKGMMTRDVKDMVCQPYLKYPDAYYRCLTATYADYKYP